MFSDKTWEMMKESVYEKKIQDVDELQERVVKEWEQLDHSVIDSPPSDKMRQWRCRPIMDFYLLPPYVAITHNNEYNQQ